MATTALKRTNRWEHPAFSRLFGVTLGLSLVYAAYFVLRFGGLWSENDTAAFSSVAMQMLRAGNALFPGQYTHGYAYPTWLGSLSLLTGLHVPVMNTVVMPFLGAFFLALMAFLTFRGWLRSAHWAILGVLLLFGSPDLLFSALRGNHEKLTIVLFLMVFYAMMQSFAAIGRGRLAEYGTWTFLMYLFEFTNATVNDYFASTLAASASLAVLVAAWIIRRRTSLNPKDRVAVRRLGAVVGTTWLLVLWVMFFVYTPAGYDFQLLKSTSIKLMSLFLTFHAGSNPYVLVHSQWAGPVVIDLVASYRWALFLASFTVWIVALWGLVVRRWSMAWSDLLLVTLYGAFGLTIAVAIPMDFAGLAAGANLEVRNFIYYVLFAVPMLLAGMRVVRQRWKAVNTYVQRPWIAWSSGAILASFIAIGLLKATLDPAISNQWLFYRPSEKQAVGYFWTHATDSSLWTGPDNRIPYMWSTWNTGDPYGNSVAGYGLQPSERDWLISPVVVRSAIVQRMPIPNYRSQDQVYDNGTSQIYHVAPQTMFQD